MRMVPWIHAPLTLTGTKWIHLLYLPNGCKEHLPDSVVLPHDLLNTRLQTIIDVY